MSSLHFTAMRLCIRCRKWFEYPETDDGSWTTEPHGENLYWVCPECSAATDPEES